MEATSAVPATAVRWALNFERWQPTEAQWEEALGLLAPEERERIGRFKRPTRHAGVLVGRHNPDAKSALVGRLLILLAASRVLPHLPLDELRFRRTPEKKPYLILPPPTAGTDDQASSTQQKQERSRCFFNFNVSHAGEWVVMAAEPEDLVGADVMRIELRGSNPSLDRFFHDMRSCFTPAEWRHIREGKTEREQLDRFFRHWTLKEAYIKAIGIGLGFELQRAEFTCHEEALAKGSSEQQHTKGPCATATIRVDGEERTEWQFELEYLDADHITAIARGPFSQALDTFKTCMGMVEEKEYATTVQKKRPYQAWQELTFEELMQCIDERRHHTQS